MAKLYAKKKIVTPKMLPKQETVQFILSYSKALKFIKIGDQNLELISN